AGRADREQFVAAAREQHGFLAHMPSEHAAVGHVVERNPAREIRSFRLGLFGGHDALPIETNNQQRGFSPVPMRRKPCVGSPTLSKQCERSIKAEGRGFRRALRRFDVLSERFGLRSPFRPCRRRPASAGEAPASSALRRPWPRSSPAARRPTPPPAARRARPWLDRRIPRRPRRRWPPPAPRSPKPPIFSPSSCPPPSSPP